MYKRQGLYIFQNNKGDIYAGVFYCTPIWASLSDPHPYILPISRIGFKGIKYTEGRKEKVALEGRTTTAGGCVADLEEKIKIHTGAPSEEKLHSETVLAYLIDFILSGEEHTLVGIHYNLNPSCYPKMLILKSYRKLLPN